jgi:hypothetical protein
MNGRWDRCYKCNEPIWLATDREEMLRRSHQSFYCLWGHGQVFAEGESEESRLRRERDRLKQEEARLLQEIATERENLQRAERRVSAAKGQITKLKKRSAEGRCPCCNRVFVNLLSHMNSKHADYQAEEIDLDAPETEGVAA